ncbi:MAG: aminotransferase class IV [Desulforhabdus sp.]|jgi:branched-chain amino acid aminotransferase/para-aminobenzoate synthetase component 1|nr:aminotransferase class IV [Desulforhabdus sp.]
MAESFRSSDPLLWLNGRFLSAREASISPLDRGFLYGDGVFETMRAEKGCVLYAEYHLQRLHRSLNALRIKLENPPDWESLFRKLITRNNLSEEVASVKVVVTRGVCPGLGLPGCSSPTLLVTAQQYHSPEEEAYRKGWRLVVFRSGFSPPLAGHKSLNYLYFLTARQAALDAGADEALILDPYGNVAETAAGSILARTSGKWWTPASDYQLPGITVKQVSAILAASSQEAQKRPSSLEEILAADTVWILNSLMGIMPVREIAGLAVKNPATAEASTLRKELFARGMRAIRSQI